jgi:hypothetical protein
MRKITDGYARQNLKSMAIHMGIQPVNYPPDMIRVKKKALQLVRLVREKEKQMNATI